MLPWLKRSLLNLRRKPFRTFLIVTFVALTVGLFTVMATVNRLAAYQFAQLEGKLETTVDIRPIGSLGLGGGRSKPLPFELESDIKANYPDLRADPYLIQRDLREKVAEFYVGVRPGSPLLPVGDLETLDQRLVAGRVFMPADADQRVAVIGLELAQELGINSKEFPANTGLRIKNRSWRVIGIFDGGNGFTNAQTFLPFDAMKEAFAAQGLSRIVVRAPSARQAWAFAERMKRRLTDQADVVTNQAATQVAQAFLAGVAGTAGTGAALFFIAGALVITGAMILAFRDQRHDIGIEKALGASNLYIARRLLTESLLLSSFGSLGGLGIAWFGLSIYSRTWTSIKFGLVDAPLPPLTIALVLSACLVLGALGSLYPIARSYRLDPVAILREE